MDLLNRCYAHCRKNQKRIAFTDVFDKNVLLAARRLADENLALPILLGSPVRVREFAAETGVSLRGIPVKQALHEPKFDLWVKQFYRGQREKYSLFEAGEKMRDPRWYGAMFLLKGKADICFAGNNGRPAEALRAALTVLGEKDRHASGFYLLQAPDQPRYFAFADCCITPRPAADQVAETAIATAESFQRMTGREARVALLSFSTSGSAEHQMSKKMRDAAAKIKERRPDISADGEIQFDAAVIPAIAAKKFPGGRLYGEGNVFVFPSLNAADIGYRIIRDLCGYQSYGAFLQGLRRSYHLLPADCPPEYIVRTAVMSVCI